MKTITCTSLSGGQGKTTTAICLGKLLSRIGHQVLMAVVLGKRLKTVAKLFQFCVIDAPPQRSQLALTTIGAADHAIVTVEASSKGVNSLLRTLELITELQEIDAFAGSVLGVLPFRDRWMGRTQAKQSQKSIEMMHEIAGKIPVLPSILESEQFKKTIDQNKLPSELGHPQLEYPFEEIVRLLGANS